jgi:hypothetical protein
LIVGIRSKLLKISGHKNPLHSGKGEVPPKLAKMEKRVKGVREKKSKKQLHTPRLSNGLSPFFFFPYLL